jgi:subtilisin family serine protease
LQCVHTEYRTLMRKLWLAVVCACCALAAHNQWDFRIQGRIPVVLPAVETPHYRRPAVELRIVRVEPQWYEPGRVAIKLRSTSDAATQATISSSVRSVLLQFGLRALIHFIEPNLAPSIQSSGFGLERVVIATFDPGFDPFDVAAALAELPDVEYATPLYIRRLLVQPNDPQFAQQAALQRLQLPAAWDITTGSADVTIAIIDSGTDYEHEDLAANLWTNPGETGTDAQGRDKRTNRIDDDGNGKIDDWRGWDFVGDITRSQYLTSGTTREDNDPKVYPPVLPMPETMQHGTCVAGTAAATTNNARGIASPAGYRCRYIPIKCGSDDTSLANSILRGYDAILYAARLGASVINCSWGGPGGSPLEQQVIDQARALGSFIVVAAGNEGLDLDRQPYYPACYRGVFTVGASNSTNDRVASFSNYGTTVAAFAPGVGIRTTAPDNAYTTVDGTSFACPLAAGIAALVRSLHPTWTADQIAAQLRYSCDPLSGITAANRPRYYGRINAYRALAYNRDFTSGPSYPGVQLVGASIDSGTAITSTGEHRLNLRIRNLLAPAQSVRLALSVSSNATVAETSLSTAQVGTLEERMLSTSIRLTEPAYFATDTVQITVTITADSTIEFATVRFPVSLPTSNTYTRYLSGSTATFTAVAVRGLSGVWAIGRTPLGRALVYRSSGNVTDTTSISGTPTALGIASNSVVCVGTGNGHIWRTSNSGTSWRDIPVTSITNSVQGIVFFDASTGVCIGQPSGTSWRVGRTSDGGASWQAAESLPAPQSGETTSWAAIASLGDTLWVGTSNARILRSTNRGVTWTSALVASSGTIATVTFSTSTLGYCAVRPSGGQAATVYRTTDGGMTWTPVGMPWTSSALVLRSLYAPARSRYLLAVCAGSQVLRSADSGATWEPVLTTNGGSVDVASGITSGQYATLSMAGQTVASLRVSIAEDVPVLRTTPSDTLDVGIARLDSTATAQLTLTNIGSAPLQVTSATIEPLLATTGEFRIEGNLPLTVEPQSSRTLTISFRPTASGQRSARLRLESNADPASRAIILRGVGMSPLSVEEPIHRCIASQSGDLVRVECTCPVLSRLSVWRSDGALVLVQSALASQFPSFDLSPLPSGAYFYRIECGERIYGCGTLIVVH